MTRTRGPGIGGQDVNREGGPIKNELVRVFKILPPLKQAGDHANGEGAVLAQTEVVLGASAALVDGPDTLVNHTQKQQVCSGRVAEQSDVASGILVKPEFAHGDEHVVDLFGGRVRKTLDENAILVANEGQL